MHFWDSWMLGHVMSVVPANMMSLPIDIMLLRPVTHYFGRINQNSKKLVAPLWHCTTCLNSSLRAPKLPHVLKFVTYLYLTCLFKIHFSFYPFRCVGWISTDSFVPSSYPRTHSFLVDWGFEIIPWNCLSSLYGSQGFLFLPSNTSL